jgi:hypothetical protein
MPNGVDGTRGRIDRQQYFLILSSLQAFLTKGRRHKFHLVDLGIRWKRLIILTFRPL